MRRTPLPLLLLLAACAGTGGTAASHGRTPEDDLKYKEAAERGEVKFGMTKDEVRTAMRGPPQRTKKTTYRRRSATCWSYPFSDIYFDEDGYVIGWQSVTG